MCLFCLYWINVDAPPTLSFILDHSSNAPPWPVSHRNMDEDCSIEEFDQRYRFPHGRDPNRRILALWNKWVLKWQESNWIREKKQIEFEVYPLGAKQFSRDLWKTYNFTFIDAENEGNCTRFINHRCQDFNAVLIPVRIGSQDTVFVRSIKPIQENEFVSIHYGSNYRKFFQYCLCETCSPN